MSWRAAQLRWWRRGCAITLASGSCAGTGPAPVPLEAIRRALPGAIQAGDRWHAAVLHVQQDTHPELGAFPAGPDPQAEDVFPAVQRHANRGIDGRLATCPSRILTTIASMNTAAWIS